MVDFGQGLIPCHKPFGDIEGHQDSPDENGCSQDDLAEKIWNIPGHFSGYPAFPQTCQAQHYPKKRGGYSRELSHAKVPDWEWISSSMAGKPVGMLITAPEIVGNTNLLTRFTVMGIPSTSPLCTPGSSPPASTKPQPKPGPTRLEHQYSLRSPLGTKHPYQA